MLSDGQSCCLLTTVCQAGVDGIGNKKMKWPHLSKIKKKYPGATEPGFIEGEFIL